MHHTCLFSFLTFSLSHAHSSTSFVTPQGELIDPVPESCRFPRRWKSAWEYSCQPRLSHVSEHRPGVAERWERPRCVSTYLNFFPPLFRSHRDAALHVRGKKTNKTLCPTCHQPCPRNCAEANSEGQRRLCVCVSVSVCLSVFLILILS